MLTFASGKPHEKLVDIYPRFERAQSILGPCIETLPAFLTIPVILFIIGLVDNIFHITSQLSDFSRTLRAAAFVSTVAILVVGALLLCALIHSCITPKTSPFRSTVSQLICFYLGPILESARLYLVKLSDDYHGYMPPLRDGYLRACLRFLSFHVVKAFKLNPSRYDDNNLSVEEHVYNLVIQETNEDESLDRASAALPSIFQWKGMRSWKDGKPLLSAPEIQTLLHLLSLEGSDRSNRGAADSIVILSSQVYS